jgi:CBS domain-containing protein
LKKAGIFTITEGVKTLALSVGIFGGSTLEKLIQLKTRGVLDKGQAADVEAAFSLLTGMRLRIQIEAAAAGEEINNFVAPEILDRVEMGRLKEALEVVMVFITTLKQHFRLDMMRN